MKEQNWSKVESKLDENKVGIGQKCFVGSDGTERTKLEQVRIRLNGKSGANRTETELNGAERLSGSEQKQNGGVVGSGLRSKLQRQTWRMGLNEIRQVWNKLEADARIWGHGVSWVLSRQHKKMEQRQRNTAASGASWTTNKTETLRLGVRLQLAEAFGFNWQRFNRLLG